MDITTILGLVIGVAVVTLAIATGSELSIFLDLPSFLIVVGGTFAATLIKFPLSNVLIALRVGVRAAFVNEQDNPRHLINQAIRMSRIARSKGLLGLDKARINNTFFQKGLQLCADGRDVDFIRQMLTKEMDLAIQRQEISERVFRAIGDSAPAFGMFGTLVGLVQMLSYMSDPTTIGRGMAVALLTTLYGVLIAHLVALPVSDKLQAKTDQERDNRLLIIESIAQIHDRANPTMVAEILESYLPEDQRVAAAPERAQRRRSTDRQAAPAPARR